MFLFVVKKTNNELTIGWSNPTHSALFVVEVYRIVYNLCCLPMTTVNCEGCHGWHCLKGRDSYAREEFLDVLYRSLYFHSFLPHLDRRAACIVCPWVTAHKPLWLLHCFESGHTHSMTILLVDPYELVGILKSPWDHWWMGLIPDQSCVHWQTLW